MSNCNCKASGRISGNPLCGLCERVCIDVKRIYDGCIMRTQNAGYELSITEASPIGAVYPFSFIRLRSNGNTVVSNLTVTAYDDERSRVRLTSTIPLTVWFTDSASNEFTAQSQVVINRDLLLKIPKGDFAVYSVEVATNVSSRAGIFTSVNTFTASLCISQIVRVVVPAEILVPSYGECVYPGCNEFSDTDLCVGIQVDPSFTF